MADNEDGIALPIVYIGVEDTPALFANNFIVQHHQDAFILTLAQLSPPILLGTHEERLEQAKNVAYVPVKIVGRFSLTRDRVAELIGVLQENLATYDKGERK
jgi:hypothetical protein